MNSKLKNEIREDLRNTINNAKKEFNNNRDKTRYLLNCVNKINGKFGLKEKYIEPLEINIELLLGECKKINYLISKYDLNEEIELYISDTSIVKKIDKNLIKAIKLGKTTIHIKDNKNDLTDVININVVENKTEMYSTDLISYIEAKNVNVGGIYATFVDSSGNNNDFTNQYAVDIVKNDGNILFKSGKMNSKDNIIKDSFTISFTMSQNNQAYGYSAIAQLVNDGKTVLSINQYADQNPYLKIGDANIYGDIPGSEYWGTDEINEYTYICNYDTHYVTIYKNGVKVKEINSASLDREFLSGTTTLILFGNNFKFYNYRVYNKIFTDKEVFNLFLYNKRYADLKHATNLELYGDTFNYSKNIVYDKNYKITPDDAYNKEIEMIPSNTNIIRTYKNSIYTMSNGECDVMVYSNDGGIKKSFHAVVTDNPIEELEGYACLPLESSLDFYIYKNNKDTSTYAFETKFAFTGFDFKDWTIHDIESVKSSNFPTKSDSEKAAYIGECIAAASGEGIYYFTIKISKEKLKDGSVASFNSYLDNNNLYINFKLKDNTVKYIVNTSSDIEIIETKSVSDKFICAKIMCDDLMYVYNVTRDNLICKRFLYAENVDNKTDYPNISYVYETDHNYILLKIPKYFLITYDAEGIKEYLNTQPLEIYAYTDCNTPTTFNMTTNKNTITIGDFSIINTEVKDANGEEISLNEVIYYSSNENIATVSEGIVYGKSKGHVTITGRTAYKNLIKTLDFNIEENQTTEILKNVEYMKTLNLQEGSTYTTNGYYFMNDNGGATYDIMSYDNYYNSLPEDCKFINTTDISFVKTPVNGYGDHILNNGLVAKVRRGMNVTPEQWGCMGDGIADNVSQMVEMFALNKTGKITFRQNAVYMCYKELKLNPYMRYMVCRLNGGMPYNRPIIANVKDLYIDGNNATIKNYNDNFDDTGSAMLNFGGVLENLTIDNLIMDGNCYTMKTCAKTNHAMFYATAYYCTIPSDMIKSHPYCKNPESDPYVIQYTDGVTRGAIKNWTIKNCTIKNTGTMYDDLDCGYGDVLLVINPYNVDGLNILNNKFLNWGRWVFAIDLGGEGDKLNNIKFNNNTCIQQNEVNRVPYKKQRGLGWIDFEAKKSFGNLEVTGNYVEGVNGFAINGNSKVSDHITFKDNTIKKPIRGYSHSYMYGLEWYSCHIDNLLLENNYFDSNAGPCKLGYTCSNITIRNNKRLNKTRMLAVKGDITIEDNNFDLTNVLAIEGFADELYNTDRINITFRNNKCGIESAPSDSRVYWTVENNDVNYFNINSLLSSRREYIDVSQFTRATTYSIRGFRPINGTPKDRHLIPGGAYFEAGETIYKDCTNAGLTGLVWYCRPENNGGVDLTQSQYGGVVSKYCVATGKSKMVCTKTGYFPCNGAFNACEADTEISNGLKIEAKSVLYDKDYVYIANNKGTLGNTITESNGIYKCGDVNMKRLLPLGKFKFE